MKTVINPFSKLLSFAVLSMALFASCSKDDDDMNGLRANVMITNAAEGSTAQDFYLDDSKVSTSAIAYAQSSNYFSTAAGSRQAKFTNAGSTTANTSFTMNLDGGKNYSVFFTGGATASSNSYTVVEDDLSDPPAGKARVRFVHLASAVSTSVDFGLNATTKLATNVAYKAASAYYAVDAATSFSVYAAGSSTVTLNIPTAIQAGKIYTIYLSGSTVATLKYNIVVQK